MEDEQVVPANWTTHEIRLANQDIDARLEAIFRGASFGRCRVNDTGVVSHGGAHSDHECPAIVFTAEVIGRLRATAEPATSTPAPVTHYTSVVMLEWSTATNSFSPDELLEVVGRILDDDGFTVHSYPVPLATRGGPFARDLESLINHHSQEGGSHTPDFILASYLQACLGAWNLHTCERDRWYGNRSLRGPGVDDGAFPPVPANEKSLLR
jgi:hypothetical protein